MCAVVALSLLGGCSKDDPLPPEAPPVTTSEASASPSPSVTEPPLPDAAKVYDQPGAEAFVRHYFELVNFGQATGDSQPMRLLSGPECVVCTDMADKIDAAHRNGGSVEGGITELSYVVAPTLKDSPQGALMSARFHQTAGAVVSADGTRSEFAATEEQSAGVVITYTTAGWSVFGIGDM